MKKSVIFIGAIDLGNNPSCGETVKNKTLLNQVGKVNDKLLIFDTINWSHKPLLLLKLVLTLIFYRRTSIILSASTFSSYRLIQFIYYVGMPQNLVYYVIGNTILEGIQKARYSTYFYKAVGKIYVEGKSTQKEMKKLGIRNVNYLPNFKEYNPQIIDRVKNKVNNLKNYSSIKFVFLSRIVPEKGCDLIFDALDFLRERGETTSFELTFYGPLDPQYEKTFRKKVDSHSNVSYGGFLDFSDSKSYEILSDYHIMLFPTFWKGEGFPGVIIDAYISGLIIIATDWNLNNELIIENITGNLIKNIDGFKLSEAMLFYIKNKDEIVRMRNQSLINACQFHVDAVLSPILTEQ